MRRGYQQQKLQHPLRFVLPVQTLGDLVPPCRLHTQLSLMPGEMAGGAGIAHANQEMDFPGGKQARKVRQGLWKSSGVLMGPAETLEGIANLPTTEEEDAQPREAPEMLSTLLQDTAQPVPPAYRLLAPCSERRSRPQPGKASKHRSEHVPGRGNRNRAGRQRHRRGEPRPGPSTPRPYRDAKREPGDVGVSLLNKRNWFWLPLLHR